jgi:hypothetical protein
MNNDPIVDEARRIRDELARLLIMTSMRSAPTCGNGRTLTIPRIRSWRILARGQKRRGAS